jgi:hypothetical protein
MLVLKSAANLLSTTASPIQRDGEVQQAADRTPDKAQRLLNDTVRDHRHAAVVVRELIVEQLSDSARCADVRVLGNRAYRDLLQLRQHRDQSAV